MKKSCSVLLDANKYPTFIKQPMNTNIFLVHLFLSYRLTAHCMVSVFLMFCFNGNLNQLKQLTEMDVT
jgi:hypothetical protein